MADEKKQTRPNDRDVEITRIKEGHKTTRFITAGVVIVSLVLIIAICYVTIVKPPWLTLVLALAAPTSLLGVILKIHLSYVKKVHRRTERLENQIDPNRTSSKPTPRLLEGRSPTDQNREQQ